MSTLRRALTLPIAVALQLVFVALSPLLLVIAALVCVVADRRFGLVRGVLMLDVYVAVELCAVAATAFVWLRAGLWRQDRRQRMQAGTEVGRWLLHALYAAATTILGLRAFIDGSDEALAVLEAHEVPLIVLSRHAGPGDSFLIVHELLCRRRQPRIVLRMALQLDPAIGLLGTLLPFCWVHRKTGHTQAVLERITAVSVAMDSDGALLLFPEGGNVSDERVRRRIAMLLRDGLRRRARQAGRLQHLAAPFTNGTLAALQGAPTADVLFLAHTGLIDRDAPLLRRIPVNTTLRMHCFHVPAADIPEGVAARNQWLFDWWQRMDTWIATVTC